MSQNTGLYQDAANNIVNAYRHISHDVVAVYVSLHTNPPGEDGDNNPSVGDPSLKLVSFDAPTNGGLVLANSPIWTNGGTTETLRYALAWDGPDGFGTDEPQWCAQLTTPQSWADEDTYTLDSFGLQLVPIVVDDGS
jgi:hypothetical protein